MGHAAGQQSHDAALPRSELSAHRAHSTGWLDHEREQAEAAARACRCA